MFFAAAIARNHEHPKPTVNPLARSGGLEVLFLVRVFVEGVNEHRKLLAVDLSTGTKRIDHDDGAAIKDAHEKVSWRVDAKRFNAETFGDGTVDQGADDRKAAARIEGEVDVRRVGMKREFRVAAKAKIVKERFVEIGEDARSASFADGGAARKVRNAGADVCGKRINLKVGRSRVWCCAPLRGDCHDSIHEVAVSFDVRQR